MQIQGTPLASPPQRIIIDMRMRDDPKYLQYDRWGRRSLWGRLTDVGVAAVLLLAASAKTISFDPFVDAVAASRVLPGALQVPTAGVVLFVEYATALTLLASLSVPRLARPAFWAVSSLGSLFLAYALWRPLTGGPVPCSCFGTFFDLPPAASAIVALAMLGYAVCRLD